MDIPLYSQWGQPWSDKLIGNTNHTMARKGCYVTSITMMMHNYDVKIDPGEVLDKLNSVDGFISGGLVTYSGVERAFPGVHFYQRVYTTNDKDARFMPMQITAAIGKIKHLLDYGLPTILCVDNLYNDGVPDHAVCAKGYEIGRNGLEVDFKIHDPDGGLDIWFSEKYGDPMKKLYGYISIIGAPQSGKMTNVGKGIWKAMELRRAYFNKEMWKVDTYARELPDTLI